MKESAKRAYARYEAENFRYHNATRAIDLEKKLRGGIFYRLYRCCEGAVVAVSVSPSIASGASGVSMHKHDGITHDEAELLAAFEAYWMMQDQRRRQYLESQEAARLEAAEREG